SQRTEGRVARCFEGDRLEFELAVDGVMDGGEGAVGFNAVWRDGPAIDEPARLADQLPDSIRGGGDVDGCLDGILSFGVHVFPLETQSPCATKWLHKGFRCTRAYAPVAAKGSTARPAPEGSGPAAPEARMPVVPMTMPARITSSTRAS